MARRFKQKKRTVSAHPKVWEFAEKRSKTLGYKGGVSGLLGGLIIFDYACRRDHWMTREMMNDPERLEKELADIEAHDPKDTTWIEAKLRELFAIPKPKSKAERVQSALETIREAIEGDEESMMAWNHLQKKFTPRQEPNA